MNSQFDMFSEGWDPVGGFVPMRIYPRDTSYRPFDGAEAKRIILELCVQAGDEWVESHAISRACRMYPQDLARLEFRLVEEGLLEETYLYYGSSKPGDNDYKGFQFGYRLSQAEQVAA